MADKCVFCTGGKQMYQQTRTTKLYINTFGRARTLETVTNDCPPFARCGLRGVAIRSAFPIRFCPECGRQLTKED